MDAGKSGSKAVSGGDGARWSELVGYLLAGMGTLIAGGAALGLITKVGTIEDTIARYLLNAAMLAGTVYVLGVRRGKISWSGLGVRPAVWRWYWLRKIDARENWGGTT